MDFRPRPPDKEYDSLFRNRPVRMVWYRPGIYNMEYSENVIDPFFSNVIESL